MKAETIEKMIDFADKNGYYFVDLYGFVGDENNKGCFSIQKPKKDCKIDDKLKNYILTSRREKEDVLSSLDRDSVLNSSKEFLIDFFSNKFNEIFSKNFKEDVKKIFVVELLSQLNEVCREHYSNLNRSYHGIDSVNFITNLKLSNEQKVYLIKILPSILFKKQNSKSFPENSEKFNFIDVFLSVNAIDDLKLFLRKKVPSFFKTLDNKESFYKSLNKKLNNEEVFKEIYSFVEEKNIKPKNVEEIKINFKSEKSLMIGTTIEFNLKDLPINFLSYFSLDVFSRNINSEEKRIKNLKNFISELTVNLISDKNFIYKTKIKEEKRAKVDFEEGLVKIDFIQFLEKNKLNSAFDIEPFVAKIFNQVFLDIINLNLDDITKRRGYLNENISGLIEKTFISLDLVNQNKERSNNKKVKVSRF